MGREERKERREERREGRKKGRYADWVNKNKLAGAITILEPTGTLKLAYGASLYRGLEPGKDPEFEEYGQDTKKRVFNEYTGQYVTVTTGKGIDTSDEEKERVAGEKPDTQSIRRKSTLTGAGTGAVVGGKAGAFVGQPILGAAIGAAVGAAVGAIAGEKSADEAITSYEETAKAGLEAEASMQQEQDMMEQASAKTEVQEAIRQQKKQADQVTQGPGAVTTMSTPGYGSGYSGGGIQSLEDSSMLEYDPLYDRRKKQIFG
jgi:hypothetical protein